MGSNEQDTPEAGAPDPALIKDHEEQDTDVDGPPQAVLQGDDFEDQETQLWAPVAMDLFAEELARRAKDEAASQVQPDEESSITTDEVPAQEAAMQAAAAGEVGSGEESFSEAEAEAARLLSGSVEVSGVEGSAADALIREQSKRDRDDTDRTELVEEPRDEFKPLRDCRMCGRKVSAPRAWRIRGPLESMRGFRCEKCQNVYCAAHIVRISGLVESLLRGARFRCHLCQ